MSVIQSIREKYAKWAVVAIALALLGFILTDYFQAKSRMSGGPTTVGVVNGKKIDYRDFQSRLDGAEAQQKAQYDQMGRDYSDAERHSTNEGLWNKDIEKIVMGSEFDKAGIEVGGKELTDYLYTNPPPDLRQSFTDQQGNFDLAGLQNMINQMKRSSKQEDRDRLNSYLADLEYARRSEKYNAVLIHSVYYPKWYVEKQNSYTALQAKVSYVNHPYTSISDSTIKITDKEIEEYVNTHKEQYRQEESRSVAFVLFDASATAADSAQLRTQLDSIKVKFATDTLPARFLSGRGSTTQYDDMYRSKTEVLSAISDSNVISISKNEVYGPFLQQHSYVLAKMIDARMMPDSVKARHILIKTNDPQTQTVVLADSIAKKRIDSIYSAIKNGARFDSLAVKYSADLGSAVKGGLLSNPQDTTTNYFTQGQMVPEFNDSCFRGKKGEKKIVKTAFGYHLIEILDQKNIQPYYKLAFFSKNIIASKETERKASEEASRFLNEAKDQKAFESAIAKSNGKYKRLEAINVGPNDISIAAIDRIYAPVTSFQPVSCRTLIKEIYKADKGDVLKAEKIGEPIIGSRQVITVVTDVLKEGTQPVNIARTGSVANGSQSPGVERILKDKKKAEQIKQMIGKVTTLEAAATALKDSIITVDSVRVNGVKGLLDPKVLGAVFNNANKGKVVPEPIAANDAVFVLRVDDLSTTPIVNGDIETQKRNLRQNGMQRQGSPFFVFKKVASIRDYRKNFY